MINPIKRYRPERHYMRGPGPKWIEKYGEIDQLDLTGGDKRALTGFFYQLVRRWRARIGGPARWSPR
jgi:hypothetical protein